MKAKLACLAVLSLLAGAVTTAQAQYPCGGCCMPCYPQMITAPPPVPVMPWGYGGYGGDGYGGSSYGGAPGINAPPPVPPFQGMLVAPMNNGGGPAGFPQHPYARSPRDFFMYYDRDNNGTRP